MAKRNKQKVREARRDRNEENFSSPKIKTPIVVDMTDQPWNDVARYSTFEEADRERNELIQENGETLSVKVKKMCKDGGNESFVVKARTKVRYV